MLKDKGIISFLVIDSSNGKEFEHSPPSQESELRTSGVIESSGLSYSLGRYCGSGQTFLKPGTTGIPGVVISNS